jgi:hypothetical protein
MVDHARLLQNSAAIVQDDEVRDSPHIKAGCE